MMEKLLITGGSGSLGRAICEHKNIQNLPRCVVYSRSESRQAEMRQVIPEGGSRGIRYILGDIRNRDKLTMAMGGCDCVIHAAAMKRIDTCEYDPIEAVDINVTGTMEVIRACLKTGVQQAILVSTDKACEPVSLYGASKMCAERMWIAANNLGYCHFNVVRYGNVLASTGSLLKIWEKQQSEGLPVTVNKGMTRFFWTLKEASDFVIDKLRLTQDRGVIYVPKMMKIYDIEEMARPYATHGVEYITNRCPEKYHEDLISSLESEYTYDVDYYYIIHPGHHDWCNEAQYWGTKVPKGFSLTSGLE